MLSKIVVKSLLKYFKKGWVKLNTPNSLKSKSTFQATSKVAKIPYAALMVDDLPPFSLPPLSQSTEL